MCADSRSRRSMMRRAYSIRGRRRDKRGLATTSPPLCGRYKSVLAKYNDSSRPHVRSEGHAVRLLVEIDELNE